MNDASDLINPYQNCCKAVFLLGDMTVEHDIHRWQSVDKSSLTAVREATRLELSRRDVRVGLD